MIPKAINDFRRENGVGPVEIWNKNLSENCHRHTLAMINRGEVYHAPKCYWEGYQEIVGAREYLANFENTVRSLIFTRFGKSVEHRQTLLSCREMGFGDKTCDGNLVITIRGR
jgi:uncharacterized protein YkwD